MKSDKEPFPQLEQRLRRALMQEALRWAQQEPPRLKAVCRSPRQTKACVKRHHPFLLAGAATAAGLLFRSAMRMFQDTFGLPDNSHFRPAVVSNTVDREALYSALPEIPVPSRPPAWVRLTVDRVIVIAPDKCPD